jgi:hypothetical protein
MELCSGILVCGVGHEKRKPDVEASVRGGVLLVTMQALMVALLAKMAVRPARKEGKDCMNMNAR